MKTWKLAVIFPLLWILVTPLPTLARKIRFAAPAKFFSGGKGPNCVAAGDFNRDGRLDVAATSLDDSILGVLLGNGDGTLQAAVTYSVDQGTFPVCVASGDFNRDGFLDLAVPAALTGSNGSQIGILLGNGDGTFQPQYLVPSDVSPLSIALADLNEDGKLDMFIGGNGASSVILGNGDGTFQAPVRYSTGGPFGGSDFGIAVADFDSDRHLDLVGTNSSDNTVGLLLNNGDGTFRSGVTVPVGVYPISIAAGDFNNDGLSDMAVASLDDFMVTILLGKGDGTFQPGTTYPGGDGPYFIHTGDFNDDKAADLVIADWDATTVAFMRGEGTGSFLPLVRFVSGSGPLWVAVGDFNHDGAPDVAAADVGGNKVSVLLNRDGVKVKLTSIPNPSKAGQPVTFTARVRSSLGEPLLPTGSVKFKDGSTTLGTVALNKGQAKFTTSSLAAGTHKIRAVYSGDMNYISKTSSVLVQVVMQ